MHFTQNQFAISVTSSSIKNFSTVSKKSIGHNIHKKKKRIKFQKKNSRLQVQKAICQIIQTVPANLENESLNRDSKMNIAIARAVLENENQNEKTNVSEIQEQSNVNDIVINDAKNKQCSASDRCYCNENQMEYTVTKRVENILALEESDMNNISEIWTLTSVIGKNHFESAVFISFPLTGKIYMILFYLNKRKDNPILLTSNDCVAWMTV